MTSSGNPTPETSARILRLKKRIGWPTAWAAILGLIGHLPMTNLLATAAYHLVHPLISLWWRQPSHFAGWWEPFYGVTFPFNFPICGAAALAAFIGFWRIRRHGTELLALGAPEGFIATAWLTCAMTLLLVGVKLGLFYQMATWAYYAW